MEQSASYSEDCLSLDKSGKYLIVGSKSAVKKETTEKDELSKFFSKNAFLFYRNAHRILSDSRMFLTPVPVQNGLMYTGTSGFRQPTLGVYVEWWLNCEANITKDKEGEGCSDLSHRGKSLEWEQSLHLCVSRW